MGIEDLTTDVETEDDGLIERFNVKGLAKPLGHYKYVCAVRKGTKDTPIGWDFKIAGIVPLDEAGNLVGNTYSEQTEQVVRNIATVIMGAATHYGLNWGWEEALRHVTETMVRLDSMTGFEDVDEVYAKYGMPRASREAEGAFELPLKKKGVRIEVKSYATIPALPKIE
ncbi:MAG: hypothetical protein JSW08_01815 [archaeon]|nr:MAG: hypothetical protein JSW08_01815 [archaeon]